MRSSESYFLLAEYALRWGTNADAKKYYEDGIRMSYMNIIYAGIVRIINERPKLNRFVMNGTTYQRDTYMYLFQ